MGKKQDPFGDKFKAAEKNIPEVLPNPKDGTTAWYAIRIDGRSFSTFTKGCGKPFDSLIKEAFDYSVESIMRDFAGAVCAYYQSDEVSIIFNSGNLPESELWFGGKRDKILSVSASLMTAYFNESYVSDKLASFDARIVMLDSEQDALDYLFWRYLDCKRNAVSSIAHAILGKKAIEGKNHKERKEMTLAEVTKSETIVSGMKPLTLFRLKESPHLIKNLKDLFWPEYLVGSFLSDHSLEDSWCVDFAPDFSRIDSIPKIPALGWAEEVVSWP